MTRQGSTNEFVARAAITVALSRSAVVLLAILWYAGDVFLVLFAGILFTLFHRGFADWMTRWLHLPQTISLVIIVVLLCCITVGGFALVAGSVAQQIDQLAKRAQCERN